MECPPRFFVPPANNQVSSLLSATYVVPWPPFYETWMSTLASINIDIGWLRRPLNQLMGMIGEQFEDWSCNLGDMSARQLFIYHFGLLALIVLSVVIAYGIALGLHKVNLCAKSFGPKFKKDMAQATAVKTFNFFVFLL